MNLLYRKFRYKRVRYNAIPLYLVHQFKWLLDIIHRVGIQRVIGWIRGWVNVSVQWVSCPSSICVGFYAHGVCKSWMISWDSG